MNNTILQGFEWHLIDDGNYFRWLSERAPELARSGISAVWLPPFCKATGTNDVGYGIYDLFDLGEFDQKGNIRTKYGTKEDLKKLVDTLHEHHILVYADLVMNHKAGADETETFSAIRINPDNRDETIGEAHDIEAWTKFTFPERAGKYSDFVWNHNHFNGVDYDAKTGEGGIFRILGENKGWAIGVSNENGNFDYLMFANIDHAHPEVVEEFKRWVDWLITEIPFDGFRLDALKHIDEAFILQFIDHIKHHFREGFYLFGEYWLADKSQKERYLYETKYALDLFDVGLHMNFYEASHARENYDLRQIFDNTITKEHPTLAVTFVDNHDTQPEQSLTSFVEPWFKKIAYGLILLMQEGYPCVFFGDYYGIQQPPIDGQKEMIDNLLYIRNHYAYGEQTFTMDDPNLIGFVRHGDEDHPGKLAVVISNAGMNTLTLHVGEDQAGKIYVDLTGANKEEIIIDDEGNGAFTVGPATLTAWAEKI